MNVTTAVILEEIERLSEAAKEEKVELNRIKDQIKFKEIELSQAKRCNNDLLNKIVSNYRNIDQRMLEENSRQTLYNESAMKSITCMAETVFYFSDDISNYIRLKKLYHNMLQIGSESSYGVALKASYDKMSDIFVVKAPIDMDSNNLLHELIVGSYGTNRLRSLDSPIINFSYIYGGFSCGMPVIKDKKVISFCTEGNPVDYVIYENINDAISAKDYVKTTDSFGFLSMFLQILFSLRTAQRDIDFTHYDLHSENVLMRKYKGANNDRQGTNSEFIQIPYQTENGSIEYLVSDRIATIIDYGMTHFSYQGQGFGTTEGTKYSEYPLLSHIYHDVYKFFMFCALDIYEKNEDEELFRILELIFYFFNKEEKLADVLQRGEQRDVYFAFPYTEISIDELIKYIREQIDISEIINPQKHPDYPVLSCENSCITLEGIIDESISSGSQINTIDNFLDYYDMSMVKGVDVDANFNYEEARDNFILETNRERDDIYNEIQQLKDKESIEGMLFLYSFLSILDKYTILLFENKIAQSISSKFNDEFTILDDDIANGLDDLYSKFESIKSETVINRENENEKKKFDFLISKVEDYHSFFDTY